MLKVGGDEERRERSDAELEDLIARWLLDK